jgi:murein DD-endopeptidase MepM/ murein hydrolase activator NlpD
VTRRAALVAAAALGCAASPRPVVRAPPLPLSPAGPHDEIGVVGVVHVVQRGETVYRIARTYGMDPADLVETNGIVDPTAIEIGTELFVPGASRILEVPPPGSSPETPPSPIPSAAPPSPSPSPGAGAARPRPGPDAGTLSWPVQGVLYGRFGTRQGERHDGIDIAAPEGTAITAAAAGTVLFAGEQSGYGSIVILEHEGGLVTLYAHASELLVRDGARVRRGQPIARVGQTGKTTGPHLHFEVRDGTRPRNPLLFLR